MPPAPEKKPSLRQRFKAMRNLPPFLRQVWQTSPALTVTSLGLRLIRALLPVAMLYVGKLIIDTALHLSQHGAGFPPLGEALSSGLLNPLLGLLALEFGLAIASDLLGRLVSYADALLSELFANATSVRLMEHAATLDLEDFEDPDLQDKLDRARRQTMGRMNLMSQLFGQVQDDRAGFKQPQIAFLIGGNLAERVPRTMRGFLHLGERQQLHVVGDAQFLQRPAHAHVAGQALAAVGGGCEGGEDRMHGGAPAGKRPTFPAPTNDGEGNRHLPAIV